MSVIADSDSALSKLTVGEQSHHRLFELASPDTFHLALGGEDAGRVVRRVPGIGQVVALRRGGVLGIEEEPLTRPVLDSAACPVASPGPRKRRPVN